VVFDGIFAHVAGRLAHHFAEPARGPLDKVPYQSNGRRPAGLRWAKSFTSLRSLAIDTVGLPRCEFRQEALGLAGWPGGQFLPNFWVRSQTMKKKKIAGPACEKC
jgi:hypothetical protein